MTNTLVGWQFQELIGIDLAIQFRKNTKEYNRIKFDANSPSVDNDTKIPKVLDDVVIERRNGKIDFYQIKCGTSQDLNMRSLDLGFLFASTGNEKSLAIKLLEAIKNISSDKLGTVTLITNREVSRDLLKGMSGKKIIFNSLEIADKKYIIEELQNEANAIFLLDNLLIDYGRSQPEDMASNIEPKLRSINLKINFEKVRCDFQNSIIRGGWIDHCGINELLGLSVSYNINLDPPADYIIPDTEFHQHILSFEQRIILLIGNPGSGKTTYIRYLSKVLRENGKIVLCHYYSRDGKDTRNLSYLDVMTSLKMQLYKQSGVENLDEDLDIKKILNKCNIKELIILIDGIDEVIRKHDSYIDTLSLLFRELFDLPEMCKFVITSQEINKNDIDRIFVFANYYNHSKCLRFPYMTGNAIYNYVKYLYDHKRFSLKDERNIVVNQICDIAKGLHNKTEGHPLSIILLFGEILSQNNSCISPFDVEESNVNYSGDINLLYKDLLQSPMSHFERDIVIIICHYKFLWKKEWLFDVLSTVYMDPYPLNKVYLLKNMGEYLVPCHGSLADFVKSLPNYESIISELSSHVIKWIKDNALEYIRDLWYLRLLAEEGNTLPLRHGLSRDWILDGLVKGYPIEDFERMLSIAEEKSLDEYDYCEAIKHRHLKIKIINAERQLDSNYLLFALSFSNSSHDLVQYALNYHNKYRDIEGLSIISISCWIKGDYDKAEELARAALSKYDSESEIKENIYNPVEYEVMIFAGVLSGVLDYACFSDDLHYSIKETFLRALYLISDVKILSGLFDIVGSKPIKSEIASNILRLLSLNGLNNVSMPTSKDFYNQEIVIFKELLQGNDVNISILPEQFTIGEYPYYQRSQRIFYNWFFICLSKYLNDCSVISLYKPTIIHCAEVSDYLLIVSSFAKETCKIIKDSNNRKISFQQSYKLIRNNFNEDYDDDFLGFYHAYGYFTTELLDICCDLHILTTNKKLTIKDAIYLWNDGNTKHGVKIRWFINTQVCIFNKNAVNFLITNFDIYLKNILTQSSVVAEIYCKLSMILFRYGFKKNAQNKLKDSWDIILGYGFINDDSIYEIYYSVKYIAKYDLHFASKIISQIKSVTCNILNFSGGKWIRNVPSSFRSLEYAISDCIKSNTKFPLDEDCLSSEIYCQLDKIDDFRNFPPKRFDEFVNNFCDYNHEPFWQGWFHYWVGNLKTIKERELLIKYLLNLQNRNHPISTLYPLVYELLQNRKSKKGIDERFEILIKWHLIFRGSIIFSNRSESLHRLDIVARDFPNRVPEFISKTYINEDNNLVLPGSLLIYLLLNVGKIDESKKLIEVMVNNLESDTQFLNLPVV